MLVQSPSPNFRRPKAERSKFRDHGTNGSNETNVESDFNSNVLIVGAGPAVAAQVTFRITETGIEVVKDATENPLDVLTWGMDAASKMAAAITKQVLTDVEKTREKQQ